MPLRGLSLTIGPGAIGVICPRTIFVIPARISSPTTITAPATIACLPRKWYMWVLSFLVEQVGEIVGAVYTKNVERMTGDAG